MSAIQKLEQAVNTIESGLTIADKLAGFFGKIQTSERQARYARWRSLRLELRAARLEIRGQHERAKVLMEKSKVWADEAARIEAAICKV